MKMIDDKGLVPCSFCKNAGLGFMLTPILYTHYCICDPCVKRISIDELKFKLKGFSEETFYTNINNLYPGTKTVELTYQLTPKF